MYRGPGFKGVRGSLKSVEGILPPGFEFRDIDSGGFTGPRATEAEHAVEELREKLDDYDFERSGLKVKVLNTVHTTDSDVFL